MTKFRKSLLIFGILVLIIGAALATFVVLSLTDSLKAEPIELEFTVGNLTRKYNGEPQRARKLDEDCSDLFDMTDGYFIEGHIFDFEFTGEQTEVGYCPIGLDIKITDKDGYDVSKQYKIKVNSGVLTVVPCTILVTINARDVVYDGAAIDIGDGYTVTGDALAKGHRVTLEINSSWLENAGKIIAGKTLNANDVEACVIDGNGVSVTQNYLVGLAGRVNIVKRPLFITPVSAEKAYDGKPLVCSQFSIDTGSLASGHYLVPAYEASGGGAATVTDVNAGNPLEIVAKAAVYDIYGDEVTENYELMSGVGYLTVNKSNLTVTLNSLEKEYDGKPFDKALDELYEISSSVDNLTLEFEDSEYLSKLFGSVTEIGTSTYTFSGFKILNGADDVTDKFNITVVAGNIQIRRCVISLPSDELLTKEYDGNFVFPADGLTFDKPLAEGHRLLSVTCAPVAAEQAGKRVSAEILSYNLVDVYGNNALGYYDILSDGSITVQIMARNLEISTESFEKEYDGITLDGGEISYGMLVSGDRLIADSVTAVNAGETPNSPEFAIYNAENLDVTSFYNITKEFGTINITKKRVTVYIDSEIEYAPNMNEQTLFKNIRCDGINADYFGLSSDFSPVCGIKFSVADFYWKADEKDEANYEIIEGNKEFTIVKRKLYAGINVNTASKYYDMRPIEDLRTDLISTDDISAEEQADFNFISSNLEGIVDAGSYDAVIIYESDCDILTVTGVYEIKPVTVTVSADKTLTATYNGLPYEPGVNELTVNSPYMTGALAVKSFVRKNDIIDAGTHVFDFRSVEIMFIATGESVKSSNVKVNLNGSAVNVTINKRKLSITLDPIYGTPDGSQNLTGIIKTSNLAEGDVMDYGDGYGVVIISGNMSMLIMSEVTVKRNGRDVTNNYELPQDVHGAVIN